MSIQMPVKDKKLTVNPTFKQTQAYDRLEDSDYVFFGGGAGSGKSWWLCESRLLQALAHPGYKSFIGREELKRLMSSTYLTWVKVCAHHGIKQGKGWNEWHLNGQYNYIHFGNGSRIDLLDVKFIPSDPLYERFGSQEYTDGALEECGEIDFRAFDVLKSRVGRHKNDEFKVRPTLALTGNPKKNWTYNLFFRPHKEGNLPIGYAFVQSLYQDNPYTAIEYEQSLGNISDKILRERLKDGNWEYDDDATALLNYDQIMSIFTTEGKLGRKYITIDPAFMGKDEAVIYVWNGFIVEHAYTFPKIDHETLQSTIDFYSKLHTCDRRNIVSDATGEGAYLPTFLRGIRGFIGGSSPIQNEDAHTDEMIKPYFNNLRSQCIFQFAQRIKTGQVSFKPDNIQMREKLIEELQQWKTTMVDNDKKIQIISKDEIRELIQRSTDYSDALYEREFFELDQDAKRMADSETVRRQEIINNKPMSEEERRRI